MAVFLKHCRFGCIILTAVLGLQEFFALELQAQEHRPMERTMEDSYRPASQDSTSDQLPAASAPMQQTQGRGRPQQRVYRSRVAANWINDHQFWYSNELSEGAKEFVFVDALKGTREPAFDHSAAAKAFELLLKTPGLPVERLDYNPDGKLIGLVGRGKRFTWNSEAGSVTEVDGLQEASNDTNRSDRIDGPSRRPTRNGADTSLTFVNRLSGPVELKWVSPDGSRISYGKVEAGQARDQHTFGGHRWEVLTDKSESLGEIVADDIPREVIIDGKKFEPATPNRRRPRDGQRGQRNSNSSPDKLWQVVIDQHNLKIQSTQSQESFELSTDGSEENAYRQFQWSPDGKYLIAFRVQAVDTKEVYRVRSSPPQGGRAVLESQPYALPGDPFPKYELNIFNVESRQQIKPDVDRFEHQWLSPEIRFSPDGQRFTYQQTDRGHGRHRLIELDLSSGKVRNIIDERSPTFIWTAHAEDNSLARVSWLENDKQLIYATEKNGWRQLILVDVASGSEIRELTPRGIVVRSIQRLDLEKRQVWITACGLPDQDPYFIHYARVEIDTGAITWLTEGNGNHAIEFSPNGQYFIDTYSRVDMGPSTELRQASDGKLICKLEQADLTELIAGGWRAPEVFVAKGRDGQTDIWGIICRPKDFDPQKKYPVIEDIYAGPQGSFVPKSFSPGQRHATLNALGFVVVQIDGMGTANRSKAFHDVCWKNLKDGGFEDRILWMKAAAERYPELDVTRVGIYGTSAGGQNAAGAVLFHPEFYKVAVAACGCHDNRMDKASWNEQWMGYPVEPHYAECSNIENADRLKGKLLLIVGEMDNNVPPESTLRFADALIRANKDFDLLVVPNAGHGMGGAYGLRRMQDYFVQHLLGVKPPDRNGS